MVTLQRDKCIGCNYCHELAPDHFVMSKKDGKTNLLKSYEKKGFFSKILLNFDFDFFQKVVEVCPVRIIKINKKNSTINWERNE